MISVVWNAGHESGFKDKSYAVRFMIKVCKVVAPDLDFMISEKDGA